ncbi:YciI family protein [Nannocystis sp. bb15-2]|uniref:YciI family protein n=2 Tax=Nannocystis bainbridge TaxID=2995303 RepID=A0ABT5EDH4_9BACT|nr:YciI family protein [Nannocystis bainbridge]MDC0723455.1 YciI family protein [Nannocystis bainbridge]
MMMVKADERGAPPSPELMAEMSEFIAETRRAGVLLDTAGLAPMAMGTRIRAAGGELTVTDGPFAEAKEVVGGFAIVKASTKEEAVELGRRFMQVHTRVLGGAYTGECEIRQMFGPDDA